MTGPTSEQEIDNLVQKIAETLKSQNLRYRQLKLLPSKLDRTPHHSWSGIGVELFSQIFIVPLHEILEILPVPRYSRVPGGQAWLLGVSNIRGNLLPLCDLSSLIKGTKITFGSKKRALVVSHGDLMIAFVVDHVIGLQHFAMSELSEEVPDTFDPAVLPLIIGSCVRKITNRTEASPVLSLYRLIKNPNFLLTAVEN
ncbi:MAG: chemotaxis protein CheW [Pseudomonadota bacterium]